MERCLEVRPRRRNTRSRTLFTRLVLVEDHPLLREGLAAILERIEGITIVAEATTGAQALAVIRDTHPDIVALDLTMPDMDGLDLLRRLRQMAPRTHVIVLSMLTDVASVRQAVRLGAGAYVLKDRATDECEPACRAVLAGTHYISSSIARGWLESEPAVVPLRGSGNRDDRTPPN